MRAPLFWAGTTALLMSAFYRGYPEDRPVAGEDPGGGIRELSAGIVVPAAPPAGGEEPPAPPAEGGIGGSGGGNPDADAPGTQAPETAATGVPEGEYTVTADPPGGTAAPPPVEAPAADPAESRRPPALTWGLRWTGSWEEGGNLTNRGDLKLHLAGPGLTLRGEVLDRRPGDLETLWESEDTVTNFLGGLYHNATGSRILYGPLEEWGLAARLRNPWSRGLPFPESRKASRAELRTAPSTQDPELYAYLGTPFLGLPAFGKKPPEDGAGGPEAPDRGENELRLRGFAAARLNPARLIPESGDSEGADPPRPPLGEGTALSAALEGRMGRLMALSLESFYTAGYIPARKSSGWFSESPPLPLRDFRLHGLGLLLSFPYISLSGDFAWSRTSIQGRDIYANLGFRAGNKGTGVRPQSRPGGAWQLSLAADGAGQHYTGSDGVNPGAGFRTGGTLEWQQSRVGLFKVSTSLSGPGVTLDGGGDPDLYFNRSASSFSYRPPATALPLRLSRFYFNAGQDAREPDTVKDSAGLGLSLAANPRRIAAAISHLNPLSGGGRSGDSAEDRARRGGGAGDGALTLHFSGSLTGLPAGDRDAGTGEESRRDISPFPRGPYRFESLKAGGEIGWSRPINLPAGGSLGRFMKGPGGRGTLQLKAGLDYTISTAASEDESFKETRATSLQAVLRGRRNRFSVTVRYPDIPFSPREDGPAPAEAIKLTLSWNLER